MSRFDGDPIEVVIGECGCFGTPHPGGDIVYLAPRLSFDAGTEAAAVFSEYLAGLSPEEQPDGTIKVKDDVGAEARFASRLLDTYLRHQVTGWNLTDDEGAPEPYDLDKLLSDYEVARMVGDAADAAYSSVVMRPLTAAVSTFSQRGQTAASTSARTSSSGRPRKR